MVGGIPPLTRTEAISAPNSCSAKEKAEDDADSAEEEDDEAAQPYPSLPPPLKTNEPEPLKPFMMMVRVVEGILILEFPEQEYGAVLASVLVGGVRDGYA